MKIPPAAGLATALALAAGAQAQSSPAPSLVLLPPETTAVTATRGPQRVAEALRDVVVLTREDLDRAGPLSLAGLLQREALAGVRANGGPGQPAGVFLRGMGAADTLVLVDGQRVGSATVGTTALEHLPLDMIERIEIVKGPLGSLYGPGASGGVVQVFTRNAAKPRLFASAGWGTDGDGRGAAGFTATEGDVTVSVAAGSRRVDAASANNARAACHDPDRDRYENSFANAQLLLRPWAGETIAVDAFASRGKARFDGCAGAQGGLADDRNVQTLAGARLTSFMYFAPWWSSRFSLGEGRDKLATEGAAEARFETRQQQVSWVSEFGTRLGVLMAGVEWLREEVVSPTAFTQVRRDTKSAFVSTSETWRGQRLEMSARRDQDDAFGARNTGTASYGIPWKGVGTLSATVGRGFRTPTFLDLYAPASADYAPNPGLRPETSRSTEVALRSEAGARWAWRVAAYDNRVDDLIAWVPSTMQNVSRARIRGVEARVAGTAWGTRVKASLAVQRPRDEETGLRLPGRAERLGRLEASRTFGAWTFSGGVTASGDRFDAPGEPATARLPGYAIADATVRYAADRRWNLELVATNLLDRRHELAAGYDAPSRGVTLNLRYETR